MRGGTCAGSVGCGRGRWARAKGSLASEGDFSVYVDGDNDPLVKCEASRAAMNPDANGAERDERRRRDHPSEPHGCLHAGGAGLRRPPTPDTLIDRNGQTPMTRLAIPSSGARSRNGCFFWRKKATD